MTIGGTAVLTGDVVVGDIDGVMFVPPDRAEAVQTAARALVENEQRIVHAIEQGGWDRTGVEAKLTVVPASGGCAWAGDGPAPTGAGPEVGTHGQR